MQSEHLFVLQRRLHLCSEIIRAGQNILAGNPPELWEFLGFRNELIAEFAGLDDRAGDAAPFFPILASYIRDRVEEVSRQQAAIEQHLQAIRSGIQENLDLVARAVAMQNKFKPFSEPNGKLFDESK